MSKDDESWRLFTSEDLIDGYKSLKRRKYTKKLSKENISNATRPTLESMSSTKPTFQSFDSELSSHPVLNHADHSQQSSKPVLSNSRQATMQSSVPLTRTPFTDITNNCQSNRPNQQHQKGKCKAKTKNWEDAPLSVWSRNLFREEFSQTQRNPTIVYDENCEETRYKDSSISGDEMFDPDDPYDYLDTSSDDDNMFQTATDGTRTNVDKAHKRNTRASNYYVSEEYASLGGPSRVCIHCKAQMWHEERVNKNVTKGTPLFSICCRKGEVKLPEPQPTPTYLQSLYNDSARGSHFKRSIRMYNSMFAFTSAGGNVDHSINRGRGPYIYRLNGQNHHVFGSLIPDDGDTPKFCQLYIYDTANEVNKRLRWVKVSDEQPIDVQVVEGLIQMLDDNNELVKKFRTARDRWENNDIYDLKVELKVCRAENGRENHISPSDEVAGIMVGSTSNTTHDRDIIIEPKFGKLHGVSYIHLKFMALQYPLLFPNGEDGYHNKIPFASADLGNLKERDFLSMKC